MKLFTGIHRLHSLHKGAIKGAILSLPLLASALFGAQEASAQTEICDTLTVDSVALPILSPARLERVDSAEFYIAAQRYAEAERCLKQALNLEPASRQNPMLLSNLSVVQTEMGHYSDALQSLDVALTMAPESAMLRAKRGALLLQLNRQPEALDDFDSALEADSTLTRPRTLRAMTLMSMQRFKEAEDDLHILVKTNPEDDILKAALARCCEMNGKRDEAEKLVTEAIKLSPQPDYYFDLIRMYILDENWDKARESVNDGIAAFPQDGPLYMLRGYLHRKRYLNTEAEADRKIAARLGVDKRTLDIWLPEK